MDRGQYGRLILYEIVWISLVFGVFAIHRHTLEEQTQTLVKKEAVTIFNKDLAFRNWATKHGGVYVNETKDTPANPYLSHIKERDLTTPSGRKLTLMNPAYMLKQIMTDYSTLFGVKGHITSLKLLNPANKPDAWETEALKALGNGALEVVEFADIDGVPNIRFMRPLVAKKGCLKCHAGQGYAVGDIRGGIGISIPLSEYKAIESKEVLFDAKVFAGFCLVGCFLLFRGVDQNAKWKREQVNAEIILREANDHLESEVAARTAQLDQKKHGTQ